MTKKHALDIRATLKAIDRKDYDYFDGLSPEERKGFSARVVMRFLSNSPGGMGEYYLDMVNRITNIDLDQLYKYPDLQYRLLAAVGSGQVHKHLWIEMPKTPKSEGKLQKFMASFYPFANTDEIDFVISSFTAESFESFAHSSGCDPDEIKEVIQAFKKRTPV